MKNGKKMDLLPLRFPLSPSLPCFLYEFMLSMKVVKGKDTVVNNFKGLYLSFLADYRFVCYNTLQGALILAEVYFSLLHAISEINISIIPNR